MKANKYPTLFNRLVIPDAINNGIIKLRLDNISIGEICYIRKNWMSTDVVAKAKILSIDNEEATLAVIGTTEGLSSDIAVEPMGFFMSINISNEKLGCVLDPYGQVLEDLMRSEKNVFYIAENREIEQTPPSYTRRRPITQICNTGIKVIDGLLTCGIGQRIGIFASAGCGKTSLLLMLIENTDADIFIIGLIGERGREVTDLTEQLKKTSKVNKTVVVVATSDYPSVDRANAALTATTIAEYFRDKGLNVILFMDSLTRYLRALRDTSLATGQLPVRRGYPASVFDNLPKLLERAGKTENGSITAFYTILLESEEESDPIADEIRSILDGHIYLSRKLAGKGHYPAIDILKSISRISNQITNKSHQELANKIREMYSIRDELQTVIELGEYNRGMNSDNDKAIDKEPEIKKWLCQRMDEKVNLSDNLRLMDELIK
ncbi:type III secretion system ATPase SctN [Citrobacter sp. wls826]|uniref:type III secretion system ATPase SctN n=1 Tax=Citrobacter sp. wls826 TaxID=2576415 RepID=UPI0010C982E8|nr:type III secretion system ATPase SctN [Citrobacter sp. wls826]TKU24776.1 FliI/YscN family ATPase [Citrobacter sp. wls826]TKV30101.1 FliI/YscN family ATPase [Citrobacter sp. TBCS-11]